MIKTIAGGGGLEHLVVIIEKLYISLVLMVVLEFMATTYIKEILAMDGVPVVFALHYG